MGQRGFFDLEQRLDALSAKGDPLETIKTTVPWEAFRADIEAVTETKPEEKKSNAGGIDRGSLSQVGTILAELAGGRTWRAP
jgi:hypothetical protein